MIRARYLEALEEERVDALPEGPYQRSFLREYAEYLGLDGDILVAEWMVRFPPPAPELPSSPPRATGVGPALAVLEHRRALALVLTLVAVGIAVWQLSSSGSTKVQATPTIAGDATKPLTGRAVQAAGAGAEGARGVAGADCGAWAVLADRQIRLEAPGLSWPSARSSRARRPGSG